jgi:hypothetical protein
MHVGGRGGGGVAVEHLSPGAVLHIQLESSRGKMSSNGGRGVTRREPDGDGDDVVGRVGGE